MSESQINIFMKSCFFKRSLVIFHVLFGVLFSSHALAFHPSVFVDSFDQRIYKMLTLNRLSQIDRALYGEIFQEQDKGNFAHADRLIKKINNRELMGYVKYQRYMHPTAYRSSYKELHYWMLEYADHFGADKIFALAQKRRVKGWNPTPVSQVNTHWFAVTPDEPGVHVFPPRNAKGKNIWRQVLQLVGRGGPSAAEKILRQERSVSVLGKDRWAYLAWRVSRSHLVCKNTEEAYVLARDAGKYAAKRIPLLDWTAGLGAWKLGRYEESLFYFERLANSETANSTDRAAGAFWAARGHLMYGHPDQVITYSQISAQEPTSFYSMIARSMLGLEIDTLEQVQSTVPFETVREVWQTNRIRRAQAASEVGLGQIASKEFLAAYNEMNDEERDGLISLLPYIDAAEFAYKLSFSVKHKNILGYRNFRYPLPKWEPENGFTLDRALLFAFIHQESQFKPHAKSGAGAVGLMQVLPSTASFITGNKSLRSQKKHLLLNPAMNMDLGQKYVEHLMEIDHIGSDLFHIMIAYNSGPGNLQAWQRNRVLDTSDPLLYIESIPHMETRGFVKSVLSHLWLYRLRMGQELPSLESIAQGLWPEYQPQDKGTLN